MKKKNKADIKEIKKRVREKRQSRFDRAYMLYKSLKRTWGDSCLAGDDYAGRFPVDEMEYGKECLLSMAVTIG